MQAVNKNKIFCIIAKNRMTKVVEDYHNFLEKIKRVHSLGPI